jgi:two-component sensor histidine kinase
LRPVGLPRSDGCIADCISSITKTTDLLSQEGAGQAIVVEVAKAKIPTALAIPLGFIVNELITNSAKYANGNIIVQFETTSPTHYSLSVSDDGPGLPPGFSPTNSKGLGMKIVLSLIKQIGGTWHASPGSPGRGACFTVRFCADGVH